VTSEEQRFVVFAMQENKKNITYNTINAKNWLIVHLPTNTKTALGSNSKRLKQ